MRKDKGGPDVCLYLERGGFCVYALLILKLSHGLKQREKPYKNSFYNVTEMTVQHVLHRVAHFSKTIENKLLLSPFFSFFVFVLVQETM